MKSNVISLDCHFSQYATICQQLQAEVRSPPGDQAAGVILLGKHGSVLASVPSSVFPPTPHPCL